ncbi:MAG: PIN domain-containing protein [Xenococcaceae cyanobacterium]
MKKRIVVVDACVLIPMPLCDTLLRAAEASLYRFHTSEQILEETAINLAEILGKRNKLEPKIAEEKAHKRVQQMKQAFPESLIEPKKEIINILKNDPKDRHVLAAAIAAKADTIVTSNLSDFPQNTLEPYKIKAVSPDEFLVELVELSGKVKLVNILQQQADDIDLNLDILLDKLCRNRANNFIKIISESFDN